MLAAFLRSSQMIDPKFFLGQWAGFFVYGPEYGNKLHGEKVSFRLYIKFYWDGIFIGECVDHDGVGSNFEKATINGFLDGDFISFIKRYPHFHGFDEKGNPIEDEKIPHPEIHYTGQYNHNRKAFIGSWEMQIGIHALDEESEVEINAGKWEAIKDD